MQTVVFFLMSLALIGCAPIPLRGDIDCAVRFWKTDKGYMPVAENRCPGEIKTALTALSVELRK